MSLSELILAIIVGFFVLKPEDIRLLFAKVKEFTAFLNGVKQEVMSNIALDDTILPNDFKNEMEQVNFYLEKIANLDSQYQGEYSLSLIKEHYRKLVNDKMEQEKKEVDKESIK